MGGPAQCFMLDRIESGARLHQCTVRVNHKSTTSLLCRAYQQCSHLFSRVYLITAHNFENSEPPAPENSNTLSRYNPVCHGVPNLSSQLIYTSKKKLLQLGCSFGNYQRGTFYSHRNGRRETLNIWCRVDFIHIKGSLQEWKRKIFEHLIQCWVHSPPR